MVESNSAVRARHRGHRHVFRSCTLKTFAQALAVAPVVSTSSTSSTRKPFNVDRFAKERSSHIQPPLRILSPACGAVAFTRRTIFLTGSPHRRAISFASNSDWL